MTTTRTLTAGLVALILAAAAVTAGVMLVRSGILDVAPTAQAAPSITPPAELSLGAEVPAPLAPAFQVSQPRDPFRPLVTEGSPTFGLPGVGGTPGTGGFTPAGTTITLEQIRDVSGVLRATVVVNGVSYDVGVGDTFADVYKVVSLTDTKGVFMFGDSVFELAVGQQILK